MSLPSVNFLHLTESKKYSLDNLLKLMVTMTRSKLKSRLQHDVSTSKQCPYQASTSYTSEVLPGQNFKGQGHFGKIKVISRSHHDTAHLQPLTNVPTTYQLPTPYGFRDTAGTRFYRSRSLQQSHRSNQGHTMAWHTYTP